MKKILSILIASIALFAANAQHADTRPHIFDGRVHSLKLSLESNPYYPTILVLDGDDRLNVNFDYMEPEVHYLRYSVTHCNADWQPSQLLENEYVDGFNFADIDDYESSQGTLSHYVNYQFSIPNENMRISKSGNYMLTVYEQDNQDEVLFQQRFSVCENVVGVYPEVTSRTDIDYNASHQQVSFTVQTRDYRITDPFNELKVYVNQNSRTDNEAFVTRPLTVSGTSIKFEHNRDLIFAAGNEFRRIETVSTQSPCMGVDRMEFFDPYYHATLRTDEMLDEAQYLYDQTQHGRFTIRTTDQPNSRSGAEYIMTHFSIDTQGPLQGGKLLLSGEFTDGLPLSQRTMRYDASTGQYVSNMLLKQGAYNYQYLFLPDGSDVARTAVTEGDKYQTVNEYVVRVYDRPMGERYDHFIGFGVIYSGK